MLSPAFFHDAKIMGLNGTSKNERDFFHGLGLAVHGEGALFHKLKLAVAYGLGLAVGDRGWVGVSQALACENKKYH